MSSLRGSRTEANLRDAFSEEARSTRRCLSYAQVAEAVGYRDLAAVLRATADAGDGNAAGHLGHLDDGHEAVAACLAGRTAEDLAVAVIAMTHEQTGMYAGMARTAHEEGFEEIADWFLTVAKAGRSHARNFRRILDDLGPNRGAAVTGFGD